MDNIEQQEETTPTFEDTKSGGVGPVLGIIVIIVLIALGGYYYLTQGLGQLPSNGSQDEAMMQLEEQSNSNAIADIEADVDATDLSEVDALLDDLDADLNGN